MEIAHTFPIISEKNISLTVFDRKTKSLLIQKMQLDVIFLIDHFYDSVE